MSAQDHEPIGTVRREPVRGSLAVCVTGGYRVMFPEHDQVPVLSRAGDAESLGVYDWPIMWCPNAASRAGQHSPCARRRVVSAMTTPSRTETHAVLWEGEPFLTDHCRRWDGEW